MDVSCSLDFIDCGVVIFCAEDAMIRFNKYVSENMYVLSEILFGYVIILVLSYLDTNTIKKKVKLITVSCCSLIL